MAVATPPNLAGLKLITEFTDGNKIWQNAAIKNAWAEVQNKSRKRNPTVRNTIIKHFSDYISRQPPFKDEPKGAKGNYTNPLSLPDTELDMDDWLEIAGQDILDRLERGGATPMTSRITAEIKQHAGVGGGGATTVTQRVVKGEDFENFKRDFPNMMNQEWGNASQPQLLKWVSSQPKYFQGVKAQFNEKLRNYIVVNWVDKQHRGIGQRPKFGVVPGAAKKLNIQNINNFKKYVFIEARILKGIPGKVKDIYRKTGGTLRKGGLSEKDQKKLPTSWDSGFEGRVVKKGDPIPVELISSFSLQFRLTAEGDKFLEKAVSDITSKVYDKLAVDLLPRMVDYIYKQMGKKTNSHAYLVEMLQIAREFSEKFDETPILIQSNIVKQKFGGINSKGKMNTTRSFMQRSGGGGGKGQFISAAQ